MGLPLQKNRIDLFGQQYLRWFTDDSMFVINNKTGKKSGYKRSKKGHTFMTIADIQYIAIDVNDKIHILNSNLQTFTFPYDHYSVALFPKTTNKILGTSTEGFYIYDFKNNKPTLALELLATSKIQVQLIYKGKEQEFYIYYGDQHIYIVDDKGNFVKKYESNTRNSDEILKVIQADFKVKNTAKPSYSTNSNKEQYIPGDNYPYTSRLTHWAPIKETETELYYGTIKMPYLIVIPNKGSSSYHNEHNILEVYQGKQRVSCHFDTKKGTLLLPDEYIKEFGIRVIPYTIKETDDTTVYSFNDSPALPPKGFTEAFEQTFNASILKEATIKSEKQIGFTVNHDGSISNIFFSPMVNDPDLREKINTFLTQYNNGWQPAILSDLKVRNEYIIRFKEK